MTDKQLIEKLNKLSEIKPRQDWVVLTKNQILSNGSIAKENYGIFGKFASVLEILPTLFYQRKLAFALSGISLLLVGIIGFVGYSNLNSNKGGQVAFIPTEFLTKSQIESANNSLQSLAQLVKDNKKEEIAPKVKQFKASINDAVSSLIDAVKKDPSSIKDIAKEVKKLRDSEVLLDSAGGDVDLENASDILYKTITEQEIANFEKITLSENQQKILLEIKELYNSAKYSEAFEKMYTELNSTNETDEKKDQNKK